MYIPPVSETPGDHVSRILIPHGTEVHYEVELALITKRIWNLGFSRKRLSPQDFEDKWRASLYGYAIGTYSLPTHPGWQKLILARN